MWSNNIIEDPGILVFNTETRHMCSYWSLSSAISISIKVISATCASIDQSYQLSIIGISNLFEIKDSGDLFLKHRSGIYYGKFKFITENIWHWLKIYPDGDDDNPESDDRPYQTKLHSHSCYDAKRSMIFVNWPRALSFQYLCTSSIPLRTSAFRRRRSIQQKLWELLYFRLSLTLLDRQSKINAFIPLWNNRWWKCDEKLSQGERGRPLTMEERAGASSKCHEVQFSYVKVQFSKFSYVKVQFSKVQIHLVFSFLLLNGFAPCLVCRPGTLETRRDWKWGLCQNLKWNENEKSVVTK